MIRPLLLALVIASASGGGCSSVVEFTTPLELGEQCGDGVDNDGNGTIDCDDASCAAFPACAETCGNGRLDPGEECDDHNRLPDDGCGPDCTIDEGCGNGTLDPNERATTAIGSDGCHRPAAKRRQRYRARGVRPRRQHQRHRRV
jgi:cysteine-rich repeat protein